MPAERKPISQCKTAKTVWKNSLGNLTSQVLFNESAHMETPFVLRNKASLFVLPGLWIIPPTIAPKTGVELASGESSLRMNHLQRVGRDEPMILSGVHVLPGFNSHIHKILHVIFYHTKIEVPPACPVMSHMKIDEITFITLRVLYYWLSLSPHK